MGSSRSDKISLSPALWSDTMVHLYHVNFFIILVFTSHNFFAAVHLYQCIGPRGP